MADAKWKNPGRMSASEDKPAGRPPQSLEAVADGDNLL
jgi:hypothetical protein